MSEELKPYYTSYDPAKGDDPSCFMLTKRVHAKMEVLGVYFGADADFMRDVFEGNDKHRRTPDAGPQPAPHFNIQDCQFIGGNPVFIKDGVSTLEMRGWKCYAPGYHPDAGQQYVTLGSDPVLEKALHTFSEKYCLPGSAADHDSFIHGYRAASVETQRLKRQVDVLREGLCGYRDDEARFYLNTADKIAKE